MNNISMILSSCDKYEDAWRPFFSQLKKFWPEFNMPIYLGTESKTFEFETYDIRCPLSLGPIYLQWSERLLQLLKQIDTEFILFSLDDFWITENVDNASFEKILSYMTSNKKMGFVCLKQEVKDYSSEKDKMNCVECGYPELWKCNSGKSFRITTQMGIWRRKYLIKILRRHESAWYFETRGTWRSKFYKEEIFDVKKNVITYPIGGFFWGGKCYKDYIGLYDYDLVCPCIEKRGTVNIGDKRDYPASPKGVRYYYHILLSILPKW